jgi:ferrous iron transport protein B
MLRYIGAAIAPVFAPLGFGDWHTTVAVIAGLIAKENCVGTLRITFGSPTATSFAAALRQAYSPVAGYSFLAFNLLCAPCFAAIGTMYKEFGDTKWTLRAVGYQTALAYLTAMLIYQASQMLTTGSLVSVALTGAVILVMVYGLFFKRDASDDLYQVKNEIREEVLK